MSNIVATEDQKLEKFGNLEMVVLNAEHDRTYHFPEGDSSVGNVTHLAVTGSYEPAGSASHSTSPKAGHCETPSHRIHEPLASQP